MGEAEPAGVQRLPRKAGDPLPDLARAGDGAAGAGAVDRVADQRMADMREVNPDLVGAAGGEPAFDERRLRPEGALDAVAGQRRAPVPSPTTAIFLRLTALRPILPAISPAAGRGTPQTKAA